MDYINAEEFLAQDKEVQKAFIDWWKVNESETDLVYLFLSNGNETRLNSVKIQKSNLNPISEIVPLLTECQLRQFIEDKTESSISILKQPRLEITFIISYKNNPNMKKFINLGFDLLRAYWKVAVEVSKNY